MQPTPQSNSRFDVRRIFITAAVVAAAAVVLWMPGWAEWLQLDRQAVAAGEGWRLFTGHLTHWNADHLWWDALMFAVLGSMLERNSRRRFVGLCVASALAISLVVGWFYPEIATYRGLSGIDTALFVCVAGDLLAGAWRERRWLRALLPGALLTGLALKLGYESIAGQTLFVDSSGAGFTVVVAAHVVGAAVGGAFALVYSLIETNTCSGRTRTACRC